GCGERRRHAGTAGAEHEKIDLPLVGHRVGVSHAIARAFGQELANASARDAPCRDVDNAALQRVAPGKLLSGSPPLASSAESPANGDPNVVGTPETVGTPLPVVVHGGGLSEVDGVGSDGDAKESEDSGASGLSVPMTGAEGFGISATEGGLRPAPPIWVAPKGMPTGPTGDPGVAVPAVAAPLLPIGAQGPDRLAIVPLLAELAPTPPALAPMPPPSILEPPVVALVTAAEVAAADNAPPHATPVRGSSGDAPEMIARAPGVASSVAPSGIRVGPTG